MPVPIIAIAYAALAAYQGISAAVKAKKAKRLKQQADAMNVAYKKPKALEDAYNMVAQRAGQGASPQARQLYQDQVNRGAAAGMNKILQGGGNLSHIGGLFDSYVDANGKLAMWDEEMRVRNMNNMVEMSQLYGTQQDKEWQMNVWRPYADKVQAATFLKGQANQQANAAINTAGSAIGAAASFQNPGQDSPIVESDIRPVSVSNPSASLPTASTNDIALNLRNRYPGLTQGSLVGPQSN